MSSILTVDNLQEQVEESRGWTRQQWETDILRQTVVNSQPTMLEVGSHVWWVGEMNQTTPMYWRFGRKVSLRWALWPQIWGDPPKRIGVLCDHSRCLNPNHFAGGWGKRDLDLSHLTRPGEGGCLFWKGALKNNRYPVIKRRGKVESVQDVLMEAQTGEWPRKAYMLCDDWRCVNPEHIGGKAHEEGATYLIPKRPLDEKLRGTIGFWKEAWEPGAEGEEGFGRNYAEAISRQMRVNPRFWD